MNSSINYIYLSLDPRIEPVYYVIAVMLALLVCIAIIPRLRSGRAAKSQVIPLALLTAYTFLVFASTVFSRTAVDYYRYKLMPFWSYREIWQGSCYLFWQVIFNLIMLLPVGILLPMSLAGKVKNAKRLFATVVMSGFAMAILIELLQLITKRGLFEFDDIFHNTIGVAIGCWIYIGWITFRKNHLAKPL